MSKSIAVLPFVNMSNDIDNEYFSDGITEEIINALTKVEGLKVIARTSSFAFKGKNIDIRKVGEQLNVATILEGSVRKVQNRVRITAQLIDSSDGSHYWSKNFDRELINIFELQDEISLLIADKIRENFGHFELQDTLVKKPNISTESYTQFLKAKSYISEFNKTAILKGISILKIIIKEFPNFALGYVHIHYAYNSMAAGGLMPVKEAFEIGGTYLKTAHELDAKLPEVYHSLGWNALNLNWDFKAAVKNLKKALELKPNYSDGHQKLFITFILEENLTEAKYHINISYALDPLSDLNNYFMAYNYYVNEDYINSDIYFKKCFLLNNSFIVGYGIYALALINNNTPEAIFKISDSIPEIEGRDNERLYMNALAYSAIGNNEEIETHIQKLKVLLNSDNRERARFFLIYIFTLLKKYDDALNLIDEGIKYKEPLMTLLKVDPLLKPLHNIKRFKKQINHIFELSNTIVSNKKTNTKQLLTDKEISDYKVKLIDILKNEKHYLDASLSLRKLSDLIKLHPNQLSWLLNCGFNKNFNDFVNSYRLNYFKTIAVNPKFKHITILGLAYDSGFNSKSVFNTFFKKEENITPSKWLSEQLK